MSISHIWRLQGGSRINLRNLDGSDTIGGSAGVSPLASNEFFTKKEEIDGFASLSLTLTVERNLSTSIAGLAVLVDNFWNLKFPIIFRNPGTAFNIILSPVTAVSKNSIFFNTD